MVQVSMTWKENSQSLWLTKNLHFYGMSDFSDKQLIIAVVCLICRAFWHTMVQPYWR